MSNKKRYKITVFIILMGCISGCITSKYAHKSFKSQEIDRITVLPFMDNRKNPDPKLNFEKMASFGRNAMIVTLRYDKKYRTVLSGDIGNVSSYSVQDLPFRERKGTYRSTIDSESVDPEWIKQLGPSTEGWVLVPVLENLSTTNILIGVGGSAEISVYLFNKHTGEPWWHSSSTYKFKAGILTYGLVKAITNEENLMEATVLFMAGAECVRAIPLRDGPYLLPDK